MIVFICNYCVYFAIELHAMRIKADFADLVQIISDFLTFEFVILLK